VIHEVKKGHKKKSEVPKVFGIPPISFKAVCGESSAAYNQAADE